MTPILSIGNCRAEDAGHRALLGRTLVTGASGFIGGRLVRPGVRFLVRRHNPHPDAVVGDLENPASLHTVCEGVETVLHCAGYAHAFTSSSAEMHWRVNYWGTRNLLEAAGQAGVRRFVFLSSIKAMAEPGDACVDESWPCKPMTDYGRAKLAAEDAVLEARRRYGMHAANLRPALVYGRAGRGNLERMARGIRAGWFPPLPETGNRRSLVHVDDLVSAILIAAEHPEADGKTYIVANDSACSGREIYDAIRAALGLPTCAWKVPNGLLRAVGRGGDGLEYLLGRQLPINSEVVSRLLDSACYCPSRIINELGWQPRMSLSDGLRELLAI
jgi:UDP-glucose 4-epimerase